MISEYLSKKIARGAILVFLGMMFGRLIGYLYVILVARLGSSEYGLLSLGIAIISFLSALAILGLDQGILRYISYYKGKHDNAKIKGAIISSLKIVIPLSLIFAFILFVFSNQIAAIFSQREEFILILKIFSLTLPFIVVKDLFLVSMRALQKVGYEITVKEFIERSTRLILTFILIYFGYKLLGAVIAYFLAVIVSFIFSIYFLQKKVFPIFKKDIKPIFYQKELLSYSLPLLLAGFLTMIIAWTDILMLGIFRTSSEVGIYNVASPTAQLMLMAPTALTFLFIPIITELYGRKRLLEVKRAYKTTSRWIFLINFPIILLIILFSKQLLKILFGSEYVIGYSTLIILSLGLIFFSLSFTSSSLLNMLKKSKLILAIVSSFAILNVILNYLLIPRYGIVGSGIATSLSYVLGGILYMCSSYKFMRLQPFKLNYLKIVLAGLIPLFIIHYLTGIITKISIYLIILYFILFFGIYFSLLILFKGFNQEDFIIFNAVLKKLRIKR